MKLRGILIFALFPFLHATSYHAELVSCDNEKIVVKSEDSTLEVSLFNTKITDKKGMEKACGILKEAKTIRFELDPSSKIEEPLPVYLFADNILVQEEIIKQGYAYPMIHNPEYTYEKQLEKAYDTTQTMAKPAVIKKKKRYPMVGPIFAGICLIIWIIMFTFIYLKRKKRNLHKNEKEVSDA